MKSRTYVSFCPLLSTLLHLKLLFWDSRTDIKKPWPDTHDRFSRNSNQIGTFQNNFLAQYFLTKSPSLKITILHSSQASFVQIFHLLWNLLNWNAFQPFLNNFQPLLNLLNESNICSFYSLMIFLNILVLYTFYTFCLTSFSQLEYFRDYYKSSDSCSIFWS